MQKKKNTKYERHNLCRGMTYVVKTRDKMLSGHYAYQLNCERANCNCNYGLFLLDFVLPSLQGPY